MAFTLTIAEGFTNVLLGPTVYDHDPGEGADNDVVLSEGEYAGLISMIGNGAEDPADALNDVPWIEGVAELGTDPVYEPVLFPGAWQESTA